MSPPAPTWASTVVEEGRREVVAPFECERCGEPQDKLVRKCPNCLSWGLVRAADEPSRLPVGRRRGPESILSRPIDEVETTRVTYISSGIGELDRVTGGGFPIGGVLLFSGPAGIGKSTLLLKALSGAASDERRVLYATSEELGPSVSRRAERLRAQHGNLHLLATQSMEEVSAEVDSLRPEVLIVDSISKMAPADGGEAGSMTAIKTLVDACDALRKRHEERLSIVVVAHVNKEGEVAGPYSMQHVFDGTFYFEETGDLRCLRAIKNRYAPPASCLFEMRRDGLREITNPSEHFLAERVEGAPGSVVTATSSDRGGEGARTSLVEVQAMIGGQARHGGAGKVVTIGVERDSLSQIVTLVEASLIAIGAGQTFLSSRDLFVKIPGGVTVREPAANLPIALAVVSSLTGVPIDPRIVAFGEIGLCGEIRSVTRTISRVQEARSMGFARVLAPRGAAREDDE